MTQRRLPTPAEQPPAEGGLLRCPLAPGRWAESIPPAPTGCTVTVSFTSEAAVLEHADALALLGYVVVGVVPAAGSTSPDSPAVHVLAGSDVITGHPTWWRSFAAHADRAYNLAAGPVLVLMGDVLAAHARAL